MNTLLLLAAATATFALLGAWRRTYPHRPLVLLALAPVVASMFLIAFPGLFWPLLLLDALLVGIAAVDFISLPGPESFAVERQCGRIASLRKPQRVTLTITHRGGSPRIVWCRDGFPQELTAEPEEILVRLAPQSRSVVHYDLRPSRRGKFAAERVFLRVRSRWGLWIRDLAIPCPGETNVYPDLKQLAEYAMLARTNRLSLLGVRRTRKVGQDHDFERLRDYTPDDNYKHIDWRSTARRNRLTVRDFQASQSQEIIFLVDCGRMMTPEAAGLSLLDHALNAALMMSFVALRQHDRVGMLCFSDAIHGFIPPESGMGQMNRLLHAVFDRFPRMVESRYDEAFLYLAARCRKRALVVLVTNLIDEVNAHQVQSYLTNLTGRHLPMAVLLRDRQLFSAVDVPELAEAAATDASKWKTDGERLYRAAAAADILCWRRQVVGDLERKGVLMLDVFPEEMTAPLVNRYLEIKARHLL